ncbi:hypothetical protein ACH0AH_07820 [Microbacterium paludicola]|uniref:hypothetical protein n=1 Tax=Microbacterium paludicola TaxID=300019 RepID=UPI0038794E2D
MTIIADITAANEFCKTFVAKIITATRARGWDLDTLAARAKLHSEDLADLFAYPDTLYVEEAVRLCGALDLDPVAMFRDVDAETHRPPLKRSADVDEQLRSLDD